VTPKHLLIPFAATLDASVQAVLPSLQLPHLTQLLRQLTPTQSIGTDESSLTPPHELALAQTWGWHGEDGLWPWAAWWAQIDGVLNQQAGGSALALIQPTHWRTGRDQITLSPPEDLALTEGESLALFEALKPLFEEEGFGWIWGDANRWYAVHPCLSHVPCASLDRAIGQNIHAWLKADDANPDRRETLRYIRRLQSEAQLLLYTHPLNEAREARGQLSVNSVWVSGCGVFQAVPAGREVQIISTLRKPALRGDTQAWVQAWQLMDQGPLQEALNSVNRQEPFKLTLCGDGQARSFENTPRSFIQKIRSWWSPLSTQAALEKL
jgi:hypothetical protein